MRRKAKDGTDYVDRSDITYSERLAALHAPVRVTSARERAAAKAFVLDTSTTFSCALCGKFAFSKPTICYWCSKTL
jgi:hypothetical protein